MAGKLCIDKEDVEDKFKTIFFGLYPENPLNRCKISTPFAHAHKRQLKEKNVQGILTNF
jgi:hypothetical protein